MNIMVSPAKSAQMLKDINICFLFAQKYHTAMRYVANVRKELGIRTVFNILGPLSNPAGASMQVMGVYEKELVEPLAKVLANLGVKNALVVYGQDCLDEISMSAKTSVCEIRDGSFQSYEIEPEQFGFEKCKKEELAGGTSAGECTDHAVHSERRKRPEKKCSINECRCRTLCGREGGDSQRWNSYGRRIDRQRRREGETGRIHPSVQRRIRENMLPFAAGRFCRRQEGRFL